MLFVGTSIIHPSTEGVFLLCNILDLLIYSYNLYSDVQKGENVVVEIPVQAGEKKFKYEQKVKLVNPKLYGRGYVIGDMGHTDYVLLADDIVAVEEK